MDVVDSADGLLGVNHKGSVSNQDGSLVVIHNQFQSERTITVTLESCSEAELSLETEGDYTDGTEVENNNPDSITFYLPSAGSQEILIDDLQGNQCDTVDTVTTTDDGLTTVEISRSADVTQGQGGNGQGPNGPQNDVGGGVQNELGGNGLDTNVQSRDIPDQVGGVRT